MMNSTESKHQFEKWLDTTMAPKIETLATTKISINIMFNMREVKRRPRHCPQVISKTMRENNQTGSTLGIIMPSWNQIANCLLNSPISGATEITPNNTAIEVLSRSKEEG